MHAHSQPCTPNTTTLCLYKLTYLTHKTDLCSLLHPRPVLTRFNHITCDVTTSACSNLLGAYGGSPASMYRFYPSPSQGPLSPLSDAHLSPYTRSASSTTVPSPGTSLPSKGKRAFRAALHSFRTRFVIIPAALCILHYPQDLFSVFPVRLTRLLRLVLHLSRVLRLCQGNYLVK